MNNEDDSDCGLCKKLPFDVSCLFCQNDRTACMHENTKAQFDFNGVPVLVEDGLGFVT